MKLVKKLYIKNLVKKLMVKKTLMNNKNILDNKIIKGIRDDKGSLLQYNNKWDYSQIIYNYRNNNLLNNLKYKHIIYKYISYMLNHKIKNNMINILYKKPIILYNEDSMNKKGTIILFIYKPKMNKNIVTNNTEMLISRLITNLLKTSDVLGKDNILSQFNIKPIILKYDYLDSDIYSKSLGKFILKYPTFDKINNININNYIINNELSNKINNIFVMNKIDQLLLLLKDTSMTKMSLYNKDNMINNNLLYKLITGYDWKYRGKNYNSESNARALRYFVNNGKLTLLNKSCKSFKLNSYSNNLTKSQSYIINKNGKYNINVTLSHF